MKATKIDYVLIVGASGGLGAAFARAFASSGAHVLLAARRVESIEALRNEIGAEAVYDIDMLDSQSMAQAAAAVTRDYPLLSAVVNAAGFDVRKAFTDHTDEEIGQSLAVNLQGAMLLTRAFLPAMLQRGDGVIMHVGGFADGRLAFPYYAADFASRAGLRGFVDSVNREIAGSGVVVGYFSPSPADTEAERPFHPLWRSMGQEIVPVDAVAQAMVDAVSRRRRLAIMGGWPARLFASLNGLWPAAADRLLMSGYRAKMAVYFGAVLPQRANIQPARSRVLLRLGLALAALSFVIYGAALVIVLFVAVDGVVKLVVAPALFAAGEVMFWVGAALAGKDVISRYRRYLSPRAWAACVCA